MMSAIETTRLTPPVTPERFLELPESRHAELIDGELKEKPAVGVLSSIVAGRLIQRIGMFLDETDPRLGQIMGEPCTYRCFPHKPDQIRRPDVSYMPLEMFDESVWRGHVRQVPQLVAEVISPSDLFTAIENRVYDFRRAGTPLIWVINASSHRAQVYRGDEVELVPEDGELDGADVLPGFRCRLADLFVGLPLLDDADDSDDSGAESR